MTILEHEAAFSAQTDTLDDRAKAVGNAIAVCAGAGVSVTAAQVADLTTKVESLKSLVDWMDTYAEYMIGNMEFDTYGSP